MDRANLDALIERADLAIGADVVQRNEQAPSISVDALQSTSNIVLNLRKPDFQRETNHWDADQIVRFLESFVDYELVPSAILWQSPTFVFVIDGAHRIGLHPGIYFYSHRARFNSDLFLGFVYFVAVAVAKNQKNVFAEFSKGRSAIEEYIVTNKALITLLLQSVRSAARVQAVRQVLQYLIKECSNERSPTEEGLIKAMGLQGRIVQGAQAKTTAKVTKETKAIVRLRTAIEGAPKCPICGGRIDAKSVSYDHIKRVQDGGTGDADNVQATHFYCNHSVKN